MDLLLVMSERTARPHRFAFAAPPLALALLLALLLPGCGQEAPGPAAGALAGKVYHFPLGSDPPTLDPAQATDTTSAAVINNLFEGLVRYDHDLSLQPALAERWESNADGTQWTFHLRRGVRFHSGRELSAEDVRYSFQRLLDRRTQSKRTWVLDQLSGARDFMAGKAGSVRGIEVLDAATLRLTLERPFPPFLGLLAYTSANVVDREAAERFGADFTSHPVGTGPFRLVTWRHDDRLLLERFEGYWNGPAALARIEFRILPEETTRFQEYKAGTLHHSDIPSGHYESVRNDPRLRAQLVQLPILGVYYLGMNLDRPPFQDNLKLRRALSHAIDRHTLTRVIMEGRATPAGGILPPAMPGQQPDLNAYPYNPELARRLLAEAGYPGGQGLRQLILFHNTDATHAKVAEFVQAQLQNLGVRVTIRTLDWAAYLDLLDSGAEFDLFRMGWIADYPDPQNFLEVLFHGKNRGPLGNKTRLNDAAVNALLDRALQTPVWEERRSLYQQAEERILELAPAIFLFHYTTTVLIKPEVRGVHLSPLDSSITWTLQPMAAVSLAERPH